MEPGIAELITELGNDNLEYQLLSQSIVKFKLNKKHGDHEITFVSGREKIDSGKQAIIIWCDKEEIEKALVKVNRMDKIT